MTTHNWDGSTAVLNDVELKLSGTVISTRNLGDFTTSDLSDWLPMNLNQIRGIYRLGPTYYGNSTYQPKSGDGVLDGSGFFRMKAVATGNSGWFALARNFKYPWIIGSNAYAVTGSGKYLYFGVRWSVDAPGFSSDIGFLPIGYNTDGGIFWMYSISTAQKFVNGAADDANAFTRVKTGTAPVKDNINWFKFTLGDNSILCEVFPTEADLLAGTNKFYQSSITGVTLATLAGAGVFIRGTGTTEDYLDIYKMGGDVCDWYGENKTATLTAVDFGATPERIYWSTLTSTVTGDVCYKYRVQAVDGVWGDWSDCVTSEFLALQNDSDPVYALEIQAIFNPLSGASTASFTSASVQTGTTERTKYPNSNKVFENISYAYDNLIGIAPLSGIMTGIGGTLSHNNILTTSGGNYQDLADDSNLLSGIPIGVSPRAGTLSFTVPPIDTVLANTIYDNGTKSTVLSGIRTDCASGLALSTASYGDPNNPIAGTISLDGLLKSAGGNWNDDNMAVANIKFGTEFGLSQIGTFIGEIIPLNTPTITATVVDNPTTSVKISITGSTDGVLNYIYQRDESQSDKIFEFIFGLSGDGDQNVDNLVRGQQYTWLVQSELGGAQYSRAAISTTVVIPELEDAGEDGDHDGGWYSGISNISDTDYQTEEDRYASPHDGGWYTGITDAGEESY